MKVLALVLAFASFSAVASTHKVCAVAFNSLDRDYTSKLVITAGTQYPDLNHVSVPTGGNWDNRISKVAVAQGCTFVGYQYQDFNVNYNTGRGTDGFALVLSNDSALSFKKTVLSTSNEKISSVKCFCNN